MMRRKFFQNLAAVCLAGACSPNPDAEAELPATETPLLGKIEASVRDHGQYIVVGLTWRVTGVTDEQIPKVVLFNGLKQIDAKPAVQTEGAAHRLSATIRVPESDWLIGCWQAEYWTEGSIGSREIVCLNRREA